MTPEGKVKADIKEFLDEVGFWRAGTKRPARTIIGTYYMPVPSGMGVNGIPDFVGTLVGRTFDIEAKAPGEGPTYNQLTRHEEIRAAGGIVLVIDDVSKLQKFFASDFVVQLISLGMPPGGIYECTDD